MRRHKSEKDQELDDRGHLLRAWRQWHREELEGRLQGPPGHLLRELLQFLRNMSLKSAPQLIKRIRTQDWRQIDAATKLIILHEINSAVTRLRERNGLPCFDDDLRAESRTAFLLVRELLHA